ncbi:hypothetical protein LTS08_008886 [Lithohypha guttulata]|uniref:uncharacterized protein n=1 Tax=Lithohypha guttulata TaxID=1690604 RepID=UPI002DDEF101|nr:hypothetical protein LTS08_008886 [Lithohypha guttulata]
MLQLIAYFDNQKMWYDLLTARLTDDSPEWLQATLEDQPYFEGATAVLVDYCFPEVQHASQSYSMHSCVHDWTLGELNATMSSELYWYAFDCVAKDIEDDDWYLFSHVKYSHMSQHARRLAYSRFEAYDKLAMGIAGREYKIMGVAQMLKEQVQLVAAVRMFIRALAGYEAAPGLDHTSTLSTVNKLGNLYRDQGKLEQAEQMYQRALTGYEAALGSDHTRTLSIVNKLGNLYKYQDKVAELARLVAT